jgi:hypothetical protein
MTCLVMPRQRCGARMWQCSSQPPWHRCTPHTSGTTSQQGGGMWSARPSSRWHCTRTGGWWATAQRPILPVPADCLLLIGPPLLCYPTHRLLPVSMTITKVSGVGEDSMFLGCIEVRGASEACSSTTQCKGCEVAAAFVQSPLNGPICSFACDSWHMLVVHHCAGGDTA